VDGSRFGLAPSRRGAAEYPFWTHRRHLMPGSEHDDPTGDALSLTLIAAGSGESSNGPTLVTLHTSSVESLPRHRSSLPRLGRRQHLRPANATTCAASIVLRRPRHCLPRNRLAHVQRLRGRNVTNLSPVGESTSRRQPPVAARRLVRVEHRRLARAASVNAEYSRDSSSWSSA